nr:glycoside hydrolase family 97 C-terminal domain-containing protein [Bacteroidaceae bacterium]
AQAGEYCVTAKRRGDKWYIGGITNSKPRDLQIKLDFLSDGKQYNMVSFADGANAHIIAMDYLRQESKVTSATTLSIHMTRNGGWCGMIE